MKPYFCSAYASVASQYSYSLYLQLREGFLNDRQTMLLQEI